MSRRVLTFAALAACFAADDLRAQTLNLGDPAPPLAVSKWVKGEKVETLDPEKTYVVEFWATWCGPCLKSIPHLTELQKKYGDKVTFIGVSAFEQSQDGVEPFVKKMGDEMDYRVAADDVPKGAESDEGKMAAGWMNAADEPGIPTAFVVKGGKINWIGHPMSLDGPLAKVVAGDWDLADAASRRGKEKARQKQLKAMALKVQKLGPDAEPKDVLKVIEESVADDAAFARQVAPLRYRLLLQCRRDEDAAAVGDQLVETATEDDADTLNELAWNVVDPDRPGKPPRAQLTLALKAAKRACELTKDENGAILDTLAKAYFDSGEFAKAVEAQEKAVKLIGENQPDVKDRLEQYRKAAKKENP